MSPASSADEIARSGGPRPDQKAPVPDQPTVSSEPDNNLPSMIFMPRHAVVGVGVGAKLAPAFREERVFDSTSLRDL